MSQILGDFEYLVAAGTGGTLQSEFASLPAALQREVSMVDLVAWGRIEVAPSLGFRPSAGNLEAICAYLADYFGEVGAAASARVPGAAGPNTAQPKRCATATSPSAGLVRATHGGLTLAGASAGALLHEVHKSVGNGVFTFAGLLAPNGGNLELGSLAAGSYTVVSVDTAGRRSTPTAFVTVA